MLHVMHGTGQTDTLHANEKCKPLCTEGKKNGMSAIKKRCLFFCFPPFSSLLFPLDPPSVVIDGNDMGVDDSEQLPCIFHDRIITGKVLLSLI